MAGFRIGNIEIGVSADVSQALRGISQVSRELGAFQRIQARLSGTQPNLAQLNLRAQRDILQAAILKNKEDILNLQTQRAQLVFQRQQVKNQRDSLDVSYRQQKAVLDGQRLQLASLHNQRRAQEEINQAQLRGLAITLRVQRLTLQNQIARDRNARASVVNSAEARLVDLERRLLLGQGVSKQQVDIQRNTVSDLKNRSTNATLIEQRALAAAVQRESGVANTIQGRKLQETYTRSAEDAASEAVRVRTLNLSKAYEVQKDGLLLQARSLNLQLQGVDRTKQSLELNTQSLQVDAKKVEAQLAIANAAAKTSAIAERQSEISKSIRDSLVALAAGFATGALFRTIEGATVLAARIENLKTVLNNVGQTAGYNIQQLGNFEDRVKSLGITTQAARSSLTLLAQNEQDLGQSTKLARIAQDAAAISATNSSEAFQRLVTAVERLDTRLLRSLGIVVNLKQVYSQYALETGKSAETLTAAEKQQLLLNEVLRRGARIAGTYEASMNDAFKQMTSFDRLTEELRREFGENFLPVFDAVTSALTYMVGRDDDSGLRGVIKRTGPAAAGMATFAVALGSAVVTAKSLSLVWGALGLAAPSLAGAVALLSNPFVLGTAAAAALVGELVAYNASLREASRAETAHVESLKKQTQAQVEVSRAADTVRELGAYTVRTAEQQELLNAALDKIIDALPDYNKQLVEARGNLAEFLRVADKSVILQGGGTGSFEEIQRSLSLRRDTLEREAAALEDALNKDYENFRRNAALGVSNPVENGESDKRLERLSQIRELLRDIRVREAQVEAGFATLRGQELDAIFNKQQEASETTLKITKDFEQARSELIKGTNSEIVSDYVNLTKALAAQFLTVEEAAERRNLAIVAGKQEIEAKFGASITDLTSAANSAKGTEREASAQKALSDAQAKRETALQEDKAAAERDYNLAIKQIQTRDALQRDALAAIEQRLKFQVEEIELQEKGNRLAKLQSEDADDYLRVEQATLEIARKKLAYEESTAKVLSDLYKRKTILGIQLGAPGLFGVSKGKVRSELDSVVGQITYIGRIRALQLQALAAQEQEAKIALENTRKEAKREVENFLRDTADALFVRFNSNGGLSQIAVPFQNLTKRIAEARQAFRQTTDTFREQVAKAQNQEQLLGLRSLFGQQIKSDQRAGRAKLLELIKARDALSGNETLTDDEFFKQRDELDAQILEQRRFIAEQKKFEEEERARFQERLDARAQELVQQGISVDLEAIRTGYILQQLEAVKSMVELERQRDAFYGTPRFGATQGGRARDANGNVAAPSGVPTVVPDPRALPSRARPGAGTGTVEGSTSVTEAAFGSNNAGVTTGTSAPILPGATTRGDVEALQAFIRNGPAGAAQLVQALQIKENSTHEILEGIHEAFKDASNAVLRTKDDVDRVAKVVQRDIESFRNAARARGLTR